MNTIENPQQRDCFFRVRGQTAGDFGDNPEGSLRTDYQRQHVRSGNGKSLAAQFHHLTVREYHFQTQHMVHGHPVFEGVGTS